jgi:hypothetical protein
VESCQSKDHIYEEKEKKNGRGGSEKVRDGGNNEGEKNNAKVEMQMGWMEIRIG